MPKRGYIPTEEHKRRISKALIGHTISNVIREKIGLANKGKHYLSEEAKLKIAESNRSREVSKETRLKMSKSLKGNTYRLGTIQSKETRIKISLGHNNKVMSEETKQKISAANKGKIITEERKLQISETVKQLWQDIEYQGRQRKGRSIKPNNFELSLNAIFKPFDFEYVGDFSYWVGGKNPDFIHKEKKLIIEAYGSYWHKEEDEEDRINYFTKYGYKTLIIWDSEMKNKEKILARLESFVE